MSLFVAGVLGEVLVSLFAAGAVVKLNCHFSWHAQYLVKFKYHFSWQAQYLVKFGKMAGARSVVFFNTKCLS